MEINTNGVLSRRIVVWTIATMTGSKEVAVNTAEMSSLTLQVYISLNIILRLYSVYIFKFRTISFLQNLSSLNYVKCFPQSKSMIG